MDFAGGGLRGNQGCCSVSSLLLVVILGSSFPILAQAAAIFTLDFFSRGISPRRYYLGIWYTTSGREAAVVWVANRATPLNDTSGGRLTILDNATLAVVNGAGTPYWYSSNSTMDWSNSSATVDDDGALVLLAGDGVSRLWLSFDHPTDTFIPKMTMTADRTRRRASRFVS